MNLDDPIWQTLEGGYRLPYDVSVPLKKLKQTVNETEINVIGQELWNELHHQGDVGMASYLAVPQLLEISMQKNLFNWNFLGICTVIELCRHDKDNPILPAKFHEYYFKGLHDLKQFVIDNLDKYTDETNYTIALATLAACSGQIKLGKAILQLEDKSVLDEFLEQF